MLSVVSAGSGYGLSYSAQDNCVLTDSYARDFEADLVYRYLHISTNIYAYLRISTVDRTGLIPVHLLGHYGAGWWTPLDNDRQWHFWSKFSSFALPFFPFLPFSFRFCTL